MKRSKNYIQSNGIYRIIDANINRAREGLRVCEEISRFILENRNLTARYKKIRHKLELIFKSYLKNGSLLTERYSRKDLGKNIIEGELNRKCIADIFFANIQRTKEAMRVLEEFSKLKNQSVAVACKNIRYEIYEIEKKSAKEVGSLSVDK